MRNVNAQENTDPKQPQRVYLWLSFCSVMFVIREEMYGKEDKNAGNDGIVFSFNAMVSNL